VNADRFSLDIPAVPSVHTLKVTALQSSRVGPKKHQIIEILSGCYANSPKCYYYFFFSQSNSRSSTLFWANYFQLGPLRQICGGWGLEGGGLDYFLVLTDSAGFHICPGFISSLSDVVCIKHTQESPQIFSICVRTGPTGVVRSRSSLGFLWKDSLSMSQLALSESTKSSKCRRRDGVRLSPRRVPLVRITLLRCEWTKHIFHIPHELKIKTPQS